jgi:exodeoxyribonuclease-3
MKIVSWNVNGLRSILSKGAWEGVTELAADIICLQEIKANAGQLTQGQADNFEEYHQYWNSAERLGYSGVAAFCTVKPQAHMYTMDDERFDREGRLIRLDYPEFTLMNVYVPNGKRDQMRLDYKLDEDGRNIVICGDINTAHRPIDLKNPKQNEKYSGFLPVEREWIDRYLEHGFVDIYREFFPDREQYTWWTFRVNARERNIGWRIDYYLVSRGFTKYVKEALIYDQILGSDHCPIGLELDINSR